jgi:hypothetical protein
MRSDFQVGRPWTFGVHPFARGTAPETLRGGQRTPAGRRFLPPLVQPLDEEPMATGARRKGKPGRENDIEKQNREAMKR